MNNEKEFFKRTKEVMRMSDKQLLLRVIERIWEKEPDLRLMQLLINGLGNHKESSLNSFYVSDAVLLRELQSFYRKQLNE